MSRLHHLLPAGDTRPHFKVPDCWCAPIQHFETRTWLHNAADGREGLCAFCGAKREDHEPSGCCGDGGGSTFALAAATGTAKTAQRVECEASQSGLKGNAQGTPQ